jgi:hypothetical protein
VARERQQTCAAVALSGEQTRQAARRRAGDRINRVSALAKRLRSAQWWLQLWRTGGRGGVAPGGVAAAKAGAVKSPEAVAREAAGAAVAAAVVEQAAWAAAAGAGPSFDLDAVLPAPVVKPVADCGDSMVCGPVLVLGAR